MGPVMNTVYNNYLTTYTPKPLTKYDTHKKASSAISTIPLSS